MNRVVALFVFCVLFCCHSKSLDSNHVQIEFDGGKDDFYKKYNLFLDIKSKNAVGSMKELMEFSIIAESCIIKPVMWQIDVFAGTKSDGELLFTINSNTDDVVKVLKGGKCYDNKLLIDSFFKLLHIDEIRKFNGQMNQRDFNKILGLEE